MPTASIRTLKDADGTLIIYPQTTAAAVYSTSQSDNLENLLTDTVIFKNSYDNLQEFDLILAGDDTNKISSLSLGYDGYLLQSNGSGYSPSWIEATDTSDPNTIVKRDNTGSFAVDSLDADTQVVSPLFVGDLQGNADTATNADYATDAGSATNDSDGNSIVNTYVPFSVNHQGTTDFNNIVTSGFHRVNNSLINQPTGANSWGQLIVSRGGDTVTQIYGDYGTGDLYTRSGNPSDVDGAGAWTSWKRLLTSSDANNYVTLNTDQTITGIKIFSNQIHTSFNGSVVNGAWAAEQQTLQTLVDAVRYSSGCSGSVSLTTSYTANTGGTIPIGWYNYFYAPHRTGGVNGAGQGDNHLYGTLLLANMTSAANGFWKVRISSGAISDVARICTTNDTDQYVTLNTAQTITGAKTFSASNIKLQNTAMTKGGTAPTAAQYQSWWFVDSTNNNSHSGGRLGGMEQCLNTDGSNRVYMRAYQNTASSSVCADIYIKTNTSGIVEAGCNTKFYGAVWNDYAEYREGDSIEPGYVMVETGDDTVKKSDERLAPFAGVSSDTFGFAIGQTDQAKTPIAVSGRVLVHPLRPRDEYKPGDCVCAAADGKVDIMTREEVQKYPDRIVGTVSSVPQYEVWGQDSVPVNGRIWIKVK